MAAPTLELLEWVTARTRTYDDVREAWRSNCPRTAVWDDAVTDGLANAPESLFDSAEERLRGRILH